MYRKLHKDYIDLVSSILLKSMRKGRNGKTKSMFGKTISFSTETIPLLKLRKLYPQPVYGELQTFLQGPKTIKDFEDNGCNYWELWANKNGDINLDYGNAWLDYNGVNQVETVINLLMTEPFSRRILIDAWRPDRLDKLSLPCCHYSYQFNSRIGKNYTYYVDLLWIQRSTDVMIGLPSDMLLAYFLLNLIINTTNKKLGKQKFHSGRITMSLGDAHIYQEHFNNAYKIVDLWPRYTNEVPQINFTDTIGNYSKLTISNYEPMSYLKFELKA